LSVREERGMRLTNKASLGGKKREKTKEKKNTIS